MFFSITIAGKIPPLFAVVSMAAITALLSIVPALQVQYLYQN